MKRTREVNETKQTSPHLVFSNSQPLASQALSHSHSIAWKKPEKMGRSTAGLGRGERVGEQRGSERRKQPLRVVRYRPRPRDPCSRGALAAQPWLLGLCLGTWGATLCSRPSGATAWYGAGLLLPGRPAGPRPRPQGTEPAAPCCISPALDGQVTQGPLLRPLFKRKLNWP